MSGLTPTAARRELGFSDTTEHTTLAENAVQEIADIQRLSIKSLKLKCEHIQCSESDDFKSDEGDTEGIAASNLRPMVSISKNSLSVSGICNFHFRSLLYIFFFIIASFQ